MKINTFKFRAECMNDVDRLKGVLGKGEKGTRMTIDEKPPWIGVDVEMETAETLDVVKDAMRKVPDARHAPDRGAEGQVHWRAQVQRKIKHII